MRRTGVAPSVLDMTTARSRWAAPKLWELT
jgi:hypothetical protein